MEENIAFGYQFLQYDSELMKKGALFVHKFEYVVEGQGAREIQYDMGTIHTNPPAGASAQLWGKFEGEARPRAVALPVSSYFSEWCLVEPKPGGFVRAGQDDADDDADDDDDSMSDEECEYVGAPTRVTTHVTRTQHACNTHAPRTQRS